MNYSSIVDSFKSRYSNLKKFGLTVHGIANLMGDVNVISISIPFVFDQRQLPKNFMGLDLRINFKELPTEFQNVDSSEEYIWAYQRCSAFVDRHSEEIKKALDNQNLTREELLDSICFGDYKLHKVKCIKWETEGKIPIWKKK